MRLHPRLDPQDGRADQRHPEAVARGAARAQARARRPAPSCSTRPRPVSASARRGRRRRSRSPATRCRSIVSDRLALEQIFGNLLDNAVKYLAPEPARPHRRHAASAGDRVRRRGRATMAAASRRRTTSASSNCSARSGAQDRPGEGIGLAHVARAGAQSGRRHHRRAPSLAAARPSGRRCRSDTRPALQRRASMTGDRQARHHRHDRGRRGPCPPDREATSAAPA